MAGGIWHASVPARVRYTAEDVVLWPDGFWCYRYELPDMSHRSDDYEVIEYDTDRWAETVKVGWA